MSEIRGEKVSFRKGDIVALHSLPSAQAHDPVHRSCAEQGAASAHLACHCDRARWRLCLFLGAALSWRRLKADCSTDRSMRGRRRALNAAIGDGYHAEVGSTVLRVTVEWRACAQGAGRDAGRERVQQAAGDHQFGVHRTQPDCAVTAGSPCRGWRRKGRCSIRRSCRRASRLT